MLAQLEIINTQKPSFFQEEEEEPPILKNFTGFNNSFRIIAKQNSIRKEGNVFFIDSDFDVLYTISPTTEYSAELENFTRKHGTPPNSYGNLQKGYTVFCKQIHDHMTQLPMCRDYFAMLGVINFFCSYFSTLKKYKKMPDLPSMKSIHPMGSPMLFPYLPISSFHLEELKTNLKQITKILTEKHSYVLENFFKQIQKKRIKPDSSELNLTQKVNSIIHLEIENQMIYQIQSLLPGDCSLA